MQERIVCSIQAAIKYEVPANILLAVAEKEGGKPGQRVRNSNDTYDVGPMQFNTAYLSDLTKYGITPEHVAQPGCYSYTLAAWRIAHAHPERPRRLVDESSQLSLVHVPSQRSVPFGSDTKGSQVGKMAGDSFCHLRHDWLQTVRLSAQGNLHSDLETAGETS